MILTDMGDDSSVSEMVMGWTFWVQTNRYKFKNSSKKLHDGSDILFSRFLSSHLPVLLFLFWVTDVSVLKLPLPSPNVFIPFLSRAFHTLQLSHILTFLSFVTYFTFA
jgi:hypothetical protein